MERETQVNCAVNKPNFEIGETDKFWSERFQRFFENTLLDTFDPEHAVRCEDIYGDKGWIVGHHAEIFLGEDMPVKRIQPFTWVIRDRDQAEVGMHESKFRRI